MQIGIRRQHTRHHAQTFVSPLVRGNSPSPDSLNPVSWSGVREEQIYCESIIELLLQQLATIVVRWFQLLGRAVLARPFFRSDTMSTSTSIRIDQTLYNQARQDALAEHRTIAGQIEYWAKLGRAALDNPDLPISFIAESLASMAESREEATAFVPRSLRS